jgi:mRNA-degrading endonuclease RelE of RelBE toxin-antitoxin system
MWRVYIPRRLARGLLRLPTGDRSRIEHALDAIRSDPYSGDLRHISGTLHRRRVGDYRILFDIDLATHAVMIRRIARRTTTTYR